MSLLKTTPVAAGADGAIKPVKQLKDNDRVVKHILTALALVSVAIIFFIIVFTLYNTDYENFCREKKERYENALEQYKTAISSQNQLIREYPKHARAADAMLLVGSSQAASGNLKAARATFQKVQKTYPDTEAAATAKSRLAALKK